VTRHDLEARPDATDNDAMNKPALQNRLGEILDVIGIDVLPRLVRVVVQKLERNASILSLARPGNRYKGEFRLQHLIYSATPG